MQYMRILVMNIKIYLLDNSKFWVQIFTKIGSFSNVIKQFFALNNWCENMKYFAPFYILHLLLFLASKLSSSVHRIPLRD